jgi:hypothetical protein
MKSRERCGIQQDNDDLWDLMGLLVSMIYGIPLIPKD